MPITKEDSIVADSTISSSPPPSTPPPKRSQPRRTYGRPKPAVEEPPLSVYSTTHSDSDDSGSKKRSRDALYQNPRTSEPIGSSPDRTLLDDESFDDSRVTKDASGIMDWNWKAKMKSIDEDEDIITPEKVSKASRPRVEDSENPVSLSAAQREAENPIVSFHPPTSPSDPLSTTGLRGTLSVLTIQSSPTKSPSPAPRVTHTTSRVSESESEREAEQNSLLKSSTKSSKARSSTPPTSDEEMPPKAVSKKSSRSKASRESSDRQPLDLQPEPFEDDVKRGSKKRKGALKKEAREINLERQRLQASKNVSIKEYVPSSSTKKFSVPDLLRNIGTSKPKTKVPESPIDTFSSPFDQHVPQASTSRAQLDSPSRSKVPTLDLDDESDSDDLPPVILSKPLGPKLTGKRAELAQMKERLLQRQSVTKDDDSDDDLEVTDRPDPSASTSVNRQPLVKKESAVARNVQQKLNVAHRKPSVAASGHGRKSFPGVGLPMAISNPADLNKITLRAAQNQAAETRKRKEDEWVRRGGRLESADGQQSSGNMGLAAWVEKGLSAVAQTAREPESNDEEDEEDEDYAPIERGSASPEGSDAEEEDQEDVTMVNDDEEAVQIVSRRTGSRRAVVNSDEEDEGENDENAPPPGQPRHNILEDFSMEVDDEGSSEPVMRRASLSSYATEDEGDKENIDRGENKENQAVAAPLFSVGASRPPLGSRQSSMINLEERASRLSMSPGERVLDEDDDEENQPVRRPLKALRSEESFSPSVPFSTRLQRAESFANTDTAPSPTLGSSPRFAPLVAGGGAKLDFSQFSQEDSAQAFSPKPLQAGFSDLFESGTQKEPLKKNDTDLGGLRRTDTLELTQDVALQPALEVDGSLQRRADAIFEKDQEYVLQAANDSRISALRKEATLYIKDNGFLTQTRPEGSSPEIYRAAPSPSQSQSFERFPLRELPVAHHFVDDIDDSPEPSTQQAKLRRLRKGSPSRSSSLHIGSMLGADSGDELSPPPSPSRRPTKLNAFDILGKKNKDKGQEKKRGPLDKNEFVEDQALESDEDETFGFVKNKNDEEEDGEHLDKALASLVDDKEMTEDAVAAHRVMERYQQDVEKDDAELEKLHTRAIQGEIRRNKRNRGVGVDDSDDEDEEDAENRRRRRKMNDRFDRTDIEALKNRPETAAFAQAYNRGLKDEVEDEFAYLNKQSVNPLGDILMGRPKEHEAASDDGEGDDEGGGGEDQDEDSDRPFINRSDILRELKETVKANPDGEHEEFDTNDVSFIERGHEEDEDLVPVKTILGPTKTKITSRRMDIDYDEPRPFMHDDENGQKRMKLWANAESRKTKTTAGFGRGAAAVTGLGRKAPGAGKAGVGSGSRSSASTSGQQRTSSKPLKAASSMLKSVDQKRGDLFAP